MSSLFQPAQGEVQVRQEEGSVVERREYLQAWGIKEWNTERRKVCPGLEQNAAKSQRC